MNTTVIGIGGKLRSGKDAAADHLVQEHGFTKLGMSDPLLEHALILNPYIPVNAHPSYGPDWTMAGDFVRLSALVEQVGYVEAKKNPEVRRFLQADGTEGGWQFHGLNLWADRLADKIELALATGRGVVVTGIRFHHEIRMIRGFGGRTWWVDRPDVDSTTSAAGHASENSVSAADFGHTITNAGSLSDLYAAVDQLMEGITR